jgi:peroxiredoxin
MKHTWLYALTLALCSPVVGCESEPERTGIDGAPMTAGGQTDAETPQTPDATVSDFATDAALNQPEPDAALDDPDATLDDPDATLDDPDATLNDPDATLDDPDATPDEPDAAEPDAAPEPDASIAEGSCPPQGPFGGDVGDTVPDIVLSDCDGNLHRIHASCGKALWIFEYAGWCPPCRAFASGMEAMYQSFDHEQVDAWLVIGATADFSPPDANACARIRDLNGLTMPVLYDPEGLVQAAFGIPANDVQLVIDQGSRLVLEGRRARPEDVRTALEAILE